MEFAFGDGKGVRIGRIDDKHNRIHTATISLPHGTKSRLASEIPALECHMSFLHALHVETDCGNGAAGKAVLTRRGIGGLSRTMCSGGQTYSTVNSPPCWKHIST